MGGVLGARLRELIICSTNKSDAYPHYHQRSNVESTFSTVKRKFGDYIRSKLETAMVNEDLRKFLCHNLCCLI